MENKKRIAAIVFVAVLVAVFIGASAFRYLTVVVPEKEAQEQAAEQALQEQEQAMENVGKDDGDQASTSDGEGEEETSPTVANYSGSARDLFTVLDNFTWYAPSTGDYMEFGTDGTVSTGPQRASFSSQEFAILAVEGDLESAQGATAVVKAGEQYGTMRFLQKSPETAASFEESTDSDFKVYCTLLGEGAFYKLPGVEVTVDGYENGAPEAVLEHRDQINAAVAKTVKEQLPAVSKATWNKEASISYAEADASIVLMYECNDPRATIVTLIYKPSTGSCQTFVGNDENATEETQIDPTSQSAENLPELPVPDTAEQEQAEAQRIWEEHQAQQQAQEQDQVPTEAAATGEEAQQ